VGALSEEKNVEALLSSVEEIPEAQLIIIGDGPLRASLEERNRTALGGRARFLGQVADVPSVLAAADVLALPSHTEGSPGVILEAAELGIATVATDVGGVRELVDEGVSGYLVPPRDRDALGERLQRAITDSERLGVNARRRLEHAHHPAVVVATWTAFLERAMA
jgi:glycosyltransferase involved in cell wall biosynthesis